ncbi:hypothetical protein IHE44_0011686 [Lamprotornis superbus]|uniref:Uncharacterized protein n=1 Tax=Lamprotornis superbus TaxID=245042 RepID=A0A835TU78_9PASS|nr:hypothetical protein IHE44_0011686 [Lamprotornis superbus]
MPKQQAAQGEGEICTAQPKARCDGGPQRKTWDKDSQILPAADKYKPGSPCKLSPPSLAAAGNGGSSLCSELGDDHTSAAPPKEPVLMCRSNNYPKGFYCSWHLPTPTYIPNSFNISVIHGAKDMVCEKDAVPKNRCHIRYIQLFSTVKYKVTLTVTNALGKNFTTLTFDEFAIAAIQDCVLAWAVLEPREKHHTFCMEVQVQPGSPDLLPCWGQSNSEPRRE